MQCFIVRIDIETQIVETGNCSQSVNYVENAWQRSEVVWL